MSVPIYLVALFVVMVGYNLIFVKPNEFDKERKYIGENIKSTQKAYNIKVEEENADYTGTITEEEIENNSDIIDNIPLVNEKLVVESLNDTQTESGYYTYKNIQIAKYQIDGKDQLVYVSPREMKNLDISYNNKT